MPSVHVVAIVQPPATSWSIYRARIPTAALRLHRSEVRFLMQDMLGERVDRRLRAGVAQASWSDRPSGLIIHSEYRRSRNTRQDPLRLAATPQCPRTTLLLGPVGVGRGR